MKELIEDAAKMVSESRRMAVSTGAGVSRESGIPTFRGKEGLWKNHRPEQLASRDGFLANPRLVWKWYRQRQCTAREKDPNPGHLALAKLETLIPSFTLITQNVDNLHRRAGSLNLIELHGNIEHFKCLDHSHPAVFNPDWSDDPPRCQICGSYIRPDVVWFGEPLPSHELERAFEESSNCDTFLVVGTSGCVQPAAQLPFTAKKSGAVIIEINVTESAFTPYADIFIKGKSGEILPAILEKIGAAIE